VAQSFDEVIVTRERMREIAGGEPSPGVLNKTIDHIDDICRRFIAATPFVMVATKGADDLLDISPKGDPAGFISVLDDKTLAIPDRLGNGRHDTFENLLINPEVSLFLIIPGNGDTLRISGTAMIVRDEALQEGLAINGKKSEFILIVTVSEVCMHCPKCMVRSRFWKPEQWPDRSDVPTLAEAMLAHGNLSISKDRMQKIIDDDGKERLY
jgi:PPOX class probable FMN-dependent enzyme